MVKIKNPLQCVQASGKAGDLIFARNHYGAYARDYEIPDQPWSGAQLAWQDAFTQANAWYQDITVVTPLRLQLWQDFAKNYTWKNRFGNQVHLNAKEWFVKFNIWRAAAALPAVSDPPKSPAIYWFPEITIFWDTGGIYAEVFPRPSSGRMVYFRKSLPQSHTRNFCPQDLSYANNFRSFNTGPILLVDAADIDTDPHNWFFVVKVIDEFGRSSNKMYYKVYTIGSPPTSVFPIISNNRLIDTSPTNIVMNGVYFQTRFNITSVDKIYTLFEIDTSSLSYDLVSNSWLYLYYPGGFTPQGTVSFYESIQSYNPAAVCWNDFDTGSAWSTPGGAAGVDYESTPYQTYVQNSLAAEWFRIDITSRMNLWLANKGVKFNWTVTTSDPVQLIGFGLGGTAGFTPFILNVPNVAI